MSAYADWWQPRIIYNLNATTYEEEKYREREQSKLRCAIVNISEDLRQLV